MPGYRLHVAFTPPSHFSLFQSRIISYRPFLSFFQHVFSISSLDDLPRAGQSTRESFMFSQARVTLTQCLSQLFTLEHSWITICHLVTYWAALTLQDCRFNISELNTRTAQQREGWVCLSITPLVDRRPLATLQSGSLLLPPQPDASSFLSLASSLNLGCWFQICFKTTNGLVPRDLK